MKTRLIVTLSLVLLAQASEAVQKTWSGASGDWFDGSQWTPPGVPSPADAITISNGAVSLSAPVTISNQLTWAGGSLTGGALSIASSGILSIEGTNSHTMISFTLDNGGTVNWQGTGDVIAGATYYGQTVVITNRAGGVFNLQTDRALTTADSGYGAPGFRFDNDGVVRRSGSGGTNTVDASVAFTHGATGLLDVQSGTLRFPGSWSSAGAVQVAAGARVEMTGGTVQLRPGHQSGGAGYFGVPTGTVTLVGRSVGHLEWTGGTWTGTLLTNAPGSVLTLDGVGGNLTLISSVLENGGTVNWQGTGDVIAGATYYNQTVAITNRAGALFNVLTDRALMAVDGGYGAPAFPFDNAGAVVKTNSIGTNLFSGVTFNNTGLLDVRGGLVSFNAGGTGGGEFRTTNGAAIHFAAGSYGWNGASFAGSGAARVTGTVSASGSWTSQTLGLVGGANLSGSFTNQGNFLWTGGTLSGGGLTLPSGSLLNIQTDSNGVRMTSFTLDNGGTVNWQGTGDVIAGATYYGQTVVITNRAGGVFNLQTDRALTTADSGYGAPGFRFDNDGVVRRSGSGGTNTVDASVAFTHGATGLLDVQSGTLRFPGSWSSAGAVQVAAGARVEMTGGTVQLRPGHQSGGAGYFGVPTGTVTLVGRSVGHLEWTGGTWTGTLLTNAPGSVLTLDGVGGNLTLISSVLENGGTVNWQGTGDVIAGATYYNQTVAITNRAGALFNVLTDRALMAVDGGYGAPAFPFDNAGAVVKTNSIGTNLFSGVTFNNFAALRIERGVLQLTGNYGSGSSSQLTFGIGGPSAGAQHGQMIVGGTAILAGGIATRLAADYLPTSGQAFPVIRAGVRSGVFANTNGVNPSGVVDFVPTYAGNEVLLTAKLSSGTAILPATAGLQPGSKLFGFQFLATPGTNYVIDVSSNLVDWVRLTVTNATGPVITFRDAGTATNAYRFYRVFSDQ